MAFNVRPSDAQLDRMRAVCPSPDEFIKDLADRIGRAALADACLVRALFDDQAERDAFVERMVSDVIDGYRRH